MISSCMTVEVTLIHNILALLFASACLGTFGTSLINFSKYFLCIRITDEDSVPEISI